jgi:hypothetical protein
VRRGTSLSLAALAAALLLVLRLATAGDAVAAGPDKSADAAQPPNSASAGAPTPRIVAAGIHDGHAFGPKLRVDGSWVAYGVREDVKGTFKTSYYARDLQNDGVFRTIWPNQHPSFAEGEGTASFTDLVGFEWARDARHNAMVALHKSKGEEVLLETMKVRFSGTGDQNQPSMSPDGSRLIVVSEDDARTGTDLWVADLVDDADILQLTFTPDSETSPAWHPREAKIIYEVRNRLGSDIAVFDMDSFQQKPLLRLGTSDETKPSYAPDGKRFAFLSNKDDPQGLRFDLFVSAPGDSLPKAVVRNVRRSDHSIGYCWDPLARFVIAVQDDAAAGFPLVIAPADGSEAPVRLMQTKDNMDPIFVPMGSQARLAWVALDPGSPADKQYRVVYVADFDLSDLGKVAGLKAEATAASP